MLQSRPVRTISFSARLLSGHDLYALPGENGKFNAKIQVLSGYPQSPFSSSSLTVPSFIYVSIFDMNNLLQPKVTFRFSPRQ